MSQRRQKQMAKLERLMARLNAAQYGGKIAKAARIQRKITRLEMKIGVRAEAVAQIGVTTRGKVYSCSLDKGAIKYTAPSGKIITLGYTPQKAKKMYKTKRRRKRLTERDKAILSAITQNPQAATALALFK